MKNPKIARNAQEELLVVIPIWIRSSGLREPEAVLVLPAH